jgi:hypothetical protein
LKKEEPDEAIDPCYFYRPEHSCWLLGNNADRGTVGHSRRDGDPTTARGSGSRLQRDRCADISSDVQPAASRHTSAVDFDLASAYPVGVGVAGRSMARLADRGA